MKRPPQTTRALLPPRDYNDRQPTRHCEVYGCKGWTRNGKPWCPDHAHTHSPYALHVAAENEAQLARRAAGQHDPIVEGDVLIVIAERGTATLRRVAKHCSLSYEAAERYLIALRQRGLVALESNKRGELFATLSPAKETA